MMQKLARSKAAWSAIVITALYLILAVFMNGDLLRVIFRGMALGVATVITITWFNGFWRAFRHGGNTAEDQAILAIFTTWFAIFMSQVYAVVFYLVEVPWLFNQAYISGFTAMLICFAGYLFLSAPGLTEGSRPGRWRYHIMAALLLGMLSSAFMVGILGGYTVEVNASVDTGAKTQ